MSAAEPFDPVAGLYPAARPAGVRAVDARALGAYHRALLAADGTVTRFIEAWALEPVQVIRLSQERAAAQAADAWLEAGGEATLIRRAVMLRGLHSRQFFLYATSAILPERLPPALRHELEVSAGGLGQILVASGLESRREGLWYGRERLVELPPAVAAVSDGDFLTRCYRLLAGGRPVMTITERFPWDRTPVT